MRKALAIAGLLLLSLSWGPETAEAASAEALIRLLIKKGLLTQEEADALQREAESAPAPAAAPGPTAPTAPAPAAAAAPAATPQMVQDSVDRLRDEVRAELRRKDEEALSVSATLEGEIRYRAYRDVGNRKSGSDSEIYGRTAQVDFEAKPLDWLTANLTIKSEYIGAQTDNAGQDADSTPFIDTAIITLRKTDAFPLYTVVGKRTQTNGGFLGDGRYVVEPMGKIGYEVNQAGLTAGYARPGLLGENLGLDAAVTVYRQEEQMNHLFVSGLFDNTNVVRTSTAGLRRESDSLSSFIAAVTLGPEEDSEDKPKFGVSYLSEPGGGNRNQTVGAWARYPFLTDWGRFIPEAEFYAAISREKYARAIPPATPDGETTYETLGRSFKEKVLTVGLTYKPFDQLAVGARFEQYWDDGLADAAQVWTVNRRVAVGVSYTLYEKDDIAVRLMGEYRYAELRRGGVARETAAPDQHELWGKLAVTYK